MLKVKKKPIHVITTFEDNKWHHHEKDYILSTGKKLL